MQNKQTYLDSINEKAFNEGWGIFKNAQDATHNNFELQSLDESGIFGGDYEAIKYVTNQAISNPKGFHAEAILFLAQESPNEVDSVIRGIIGTQRFEELKSVLRYTDMDNF